MRDSRGGRDAWLEIDLDAIVDNVERIAGLVGRDVAIAPVIKADAYGHGLVEVAQALQGRVEALCVATVSEGSRLRVAGVEGRIILLYPVPTDALRRAFDANLELTLMSARDADALLTAVDEGNRPPSAVRVQIAIETGFGRGGVPPEAAIELARCLRSAEVEVAGVWSHLATPADAATTGAQLERFESVVDGLSSAGMTPAAHIASSSGIFLGLAPELALVRPGLAIYGELDPDLRLDPSAAAVAASLRPAMAVKARPIAVQDVPIGGRVGYGGTWHAQRPSRVATLPLGYADGLARATQPGGEALVRGRRVPLVGVVSMDSVGVDVTDVVDVGPDDEFVLLGSQGDERISAADLARQRNTIAWEVLTGMAARLAPVYHRSTEPTS